MPHLLAAWLAIGCVVFAVVVSFEPRHTFTLATTNLFVYLFLGEVLLFIYAASLGSISVRILVTMRRFEPSPEALDRSLAIHSPTAFLDVRLDSLMAWGMLRQRDGHYEITPRGRVWAHGVSSLKRLLAVGRGG
ncbi:MAG: hypothetical protein DMD91_19910 [Candidatus Rokuibacteriota bacterium]|nr:MAG: hypothetical protein DMD91_19910 [Candidatus Rokubacteria bacterium]